MKNTKLPALEREDILPAFPAGPQRRAMRGLVDAIETLTRLVAGISSRLEQPDDDGQSGDQTDTEPPATGFMLDGETALRGFLLSSAELGPVWAGEYTTDLRSRCRRLRDAAARHFDNATRLQDDPRHPDYPHVGEDRHVDKLLIRIPGSGEEWIVDFCINAVEPGYLYRTSDQSGKLNFLKHKAAPWGALA